MRNTLIVALIVVVSILASQLLDVRLAEQYRMQCFRDWAYREQQKAILESSLVSQKTSVMIEIGSCDSYSSQ